MTFQETRYLMDAYVGAVYVGGGFAAVLSWITALVYHRDPSKAQGQLPIPDAKRPKMDASVPPMGTPGVGAGGGMSPGMGGAYGNYGGFQHSFPQGPAYAPPPPHMPPPPPTAAPPPLPPQNPLNPAQPHSAFLPLFNQTAQQRRLEVQYPAQFSGPAHAGRWTVQCLGMLIRPVRICASTDRTLPQSTGWRKALAPVPASSSRRRRPRDRRTTLWVGLPVSVYPL